MSKWFVDQSDLGIVNSLETIAICEEDAGIIAEVYLDGGMGPERAQMMAAAPEMLEALMEAIPLLHVYGSGKWAEVRQQAMEAIAKATGGKHG